MNDRYDVIVIGSGISGLNCCLNLDPKLNILLLAKDTISTTNTSLAQGGIATAVNEDDFAPFIEDTMKAGKYHNDREAVTVLVQNSFAGIQSLIHLGVNFDKKNDLLDFTREGGHSKNRIVHVKDKTGEYVEKTMIAAVLTKPNVEIVEFAKLLDLITEDGKCAGVILKHDNDIKCIKSKVTILATGGIGGLFKSSTNQRILEGDGIGVALKNKVELKDMDCIQFHPTVFYDGGKTDKRKLLITESLRGEGGRLYNLKGERFVDELLPRDVVTEAIKKETETGDPYVLLDISYQDSDFIRNRFPLMYAECLSIGIDITKEPIPVFPAQHYMMGGVKVDTYARTSMPNLFAVGETGCTGIHGRNRLASNSLLEGLVFTKRASDVINASIETRQISAQKTARQPADYYEIINLGHLVKKEIMKWTDRYHDEFI